MRDGAIGFHRGRGLPWVAPVQLHGMGRCLERCIGLAVDEVPLVHQIAAHGLVQQGGTGLLCRDRVHDSLQRFIIDLNGLDGVFG